MKKLKAKDLEHVKFVVVPELSRLVQEHLFKLGISWEWKAMEVAHTNKPFLYINYGANLTYGDLYISYNDGSHKEILASDILKIPISKPKFKELTVSEISEKLGYNVKIIKETK